MKRILFLMFALLIVVSSWSQNNASISGVVKDEFGEAVFGANVVLDVSKGLGVQTDFDGAYTISVPAGTYSLVLSYIGYETQKMDISVSSNQNLNLNFTLKSTEEVITTVTISSSTRRGIVAEKEVVTVETISTEMLENNVITIGSDAVDKVAGVTLLDGQVSIRGGSGYAYGTGSRVILVIDEIPLLSPERNEILWDFLPMENVRSIDVVKGASSVQYGASALNGIVSATTNWPSKKKETSITSFATMYNKPPIREGQWWQYDENFREAPHELGVQFAHMRKLTDEMDLVFSGAFISNQTHIKTQLNHRVRNNIKWRYMPEKIPGLTLQLNSNLLYRNNDSFFIWENGDEGAYDGRSYSDRYLRYSVDPVVKYFFKENNQISFINRIYYDQRLSKGAEEVDYFGIKAYNDFQYKRTYRNMEKSIKGSSSIGIVNSHDVIKAYSFRDYSNDGKGIFHFNTLSAYTQSDFGWRDLTLALGARFDFITLDGLNKASKPVFNAGASYEIGTNNFVRFGFGQSFRIPSVAERFVKEKITSFSFGPVSRDIYALPNPDIQPETGFSYELGYKKILKYPKFNASFDAVLFYQAFNEMTEFTFGSYLNPIDSVVYTGFQSRNIAKARIFGWETSITGTNNFEKCTLTYQFGYTYSYAANAEEDTTLAKFGAVVKNAFRAVKITDEEYVDFYDNAEQNILYGLLRYRFRNTIKMDLNLEVKKWSIGTNIRYYGFMDRVDAVFALAIPDIQDYRDSQNFKGDFVVDLRARYQFSEQFTLGFICKNMFNNDYQLRPAKADAPRTYTLQGILKF
jgi:outer membrane receptor protein involved in Fe transport